MSDEIHFSKNGAKIFCRYLKKYIHSKSLIMTIISNFAQYFYIRFKYYNINNLEIIFFKSDPNNYLYIFHILNILNRYVWAI